MTRSSTACATAAAPSRPAVTASLLAACALALAVAAPALAAPGDQPVRPLKPAETPAADTTRIRSTTLPARGLFVGDQLSPAARERLTELIVDAHGLDVEVALLVPTGPWQIDGSGQGERDLTPARLTAVRRYLQDRGVDPKRIFVESRIDAKVREPQLTLQMIGRPARD